MEKWFDDVHEESKKLKIEENIKPEEGESSQIDISTTNQSNNEAQPQTSSVPLNENSEISTQDQVKSKLSNIFGKIKEIKIKKPDFAKNIKKSSFNNSKVGNYKSKIQNFFKSKLGKSSVQGEEIIGIELANKEIRIVQVSSNKANQWVLEKILYF